MHAGCLSNKTSHHTQNISGISSEVKDALNTLFLCALYPVILWEEWGRNQKYVFLSCQFTCY